MERITYKGRMIEVVEQDVELNGTQKTFEFARRSPGTRLIIPKGDRVLITREFRHELQAYDYRLPGGKVYDTLEEYDAAMTSGVDIAEAARRAAIKEAKEEAGIEVKSIEYLHTSVCGATVKWDLFYFLVTDFDQTEQHLEDGEDISIEFIERERVREMCLDGSVSEERSALALLRFLKV